MNLVVPDIAQCLTTVLNIEYSKIARRKLERELGRKKVFTIYRHSPAES